MARLSLFVHGDQAIHLLVPSWEELVPHMEGYVKLGFYPTKRPHGESSTNEAFPLTQPAWRDSSAAFCIVLDAKLSLLAWSDEFLKLLGHESDEGLKRQDNCTMAYLLSVDQFEDVRQAVLEASETGERDVTLDFSVTDTDGEIKSHDCYGRFAYGEGNEPVMVGFIPDPIDKRTMEDCYRFFEEEYHLVCGQSDKYYLVYDFYLQSIFPRFDDLIPPGLLYAISSQPYDMIDSGLIANDDHDAFIVFYKKILSGSPIADTDIRFKGTDGEYHLYHLESNTIFNNDKTPRRALISACIKTDQDAACEKWLSSLAYTDSDFVLYLEANLTQDKIESRRVTWKSHSDDLSIEEFTRLTDVLGQSYAYQEDRQSFQEFMSRERLLALYSSGVCEDTFEFRMVTGDDPLRTHVILHLSQYPFSEDIKACITIIAIERHRRELEQLEQRASMDSLTKALNRTAIEKRITDILQRASDNETSALYMIDLDNFKEINDRLGHQQGDETLIYVVSAIREVFRSSDVIGRLGGDEFMVFMSGKITTELIRKRAMSVVDALQLSVGGAGGLDISASVGVVIVDGGGADFSTLYKLVDNALYVAKRAGKNRCHIVRVGASSLPEAPASPANTIQLQTLLQYMDGGVVLFVIGAKIRLLYASPGVTAPLVRGSIDLSDGGEAIFSRIFPMDSKVLEVAMRESAENDMPVDITFRVLSYEEEIRWFHARAVRIPYDDSEYPVMTAVITDVTKLKEQESTLRESGERTRIAFNQTSQTLWEVDIRERTFTTFNLEGQEADDKQVAYSDIPKSMLDADVPHPASKAVFAQFMNDLLSGKPEDSAVFVVRYFQTSIYGWARASYHTLYGEDGMPLKAIGTFEKMPTIFNEQTRFQQAETLFEALAGHEMDLLIVNLTTDTIKNASANLKHVEGGRYSTLAREYGYAALSDEDALKQRRFMPQALAEAYAAGTTWVEAEYRHRGAAHRSARWVSCVASLIVEPMTRELYAFVIRRDVDIRRRWELSLPSHARRDGVSRLHAPAAVETVVASLIRERIQTDALCSLALVSVDGMSQVSESLSEEGIERVRFSVDRLFRILLDHECVVGQLSEDRILVFWPEVLSDRQVRAKLEDAVETVQRVCRTSKIPEHVTFTSGIATVRCDQADYEGMCTRASYACDKHGNGRRGLVVTSDGLTEDGQRLTDMVDARELTVTDEEEALRPLMPDEKEALLTCIVKMMSAESYETAMIGVLKTLGTHYGADRVYQLALSEESGTLSATGEWVARGKHTLMKQLAGVSVAEFPILGVALESKQPILLHGPSKRAHGPASLEEEWRYICGPVMEEERVLGFVCVENPREHYADTALLSVTIPIMLLEQRRRNHGDDTDGADSLTGALDQRAYDDELNAPDADAPSSVGVLCVDINGLDQINRERGFEYGNTLLIVAARTLSLAFSCGKVFRVTGHSFVVLYPDVTHAAFLDACARAQSALDKQSPRRFSLGYTWADRDFTIRRLAEHARSIMDHNKQSCHRATKKDGARRESKYFTDLRLAISEGRYTVYIQPKTKLSTDEVVGGEALVRYLDPLRGIVSPSEFIGKMEEEHVIRELDFFVLDQTLSIMQDWREHGMEPVPISVNFSYQTLLDHSALAAALAIRSRYDIPAEYIEIEIAETLGMMERQTIAHAVEGFQEQGFRVSLDDFGSEYSSIMVLSDILFDWVKLDKSIIGNFVTNKISRSILESMVNICGVMGARCIAEGVETSEQVAALKDAGCDYAQGYYYNKPLPADEFGKRYLYAG